MNEVIIGVTRVKGIQAMIGTGKMSLHANYMADRVLSPSNAHSFDEKPYLLTALTVKYMPNVKSDIVLTVNNILDRDDNINHGSSHYSTVPTNFLLTYNYRL